MKGRLLIIVPAYNEEGSVGTVIHQIKRDLELQGDILVIDDGSTDDTAVVARKAGALVVSHPFNLGIGGAVQTGYIFADKMGYDLVARMDGDGQHDAEQLSGLIEMVISGEVDIAIGSRYLGKGGFRSSVSRAVGIKIFALLVSLIARQPFTDTTSGFQAMNREAACFLARHLPTDYPEIEGLILLRRAGFRVLEASVTMRPRQGGQSSITSLMSIYYVFKVLLAVFIEILRRPLSR
jgi:glycosyltransferase involved in cell wall biosynthesis